MAHNPLLGSRISLISKKNIRYEGTLYSINESDATVALQNVRSYGTEGRETEASFVPPQDVVHPYLLFRGCDIKDLHVHESSDSKSAEDLPADPAILSAEAPEEEKETTTDPSETNEKAVEDKSPKEEEAETEEKEDVKEEVKPKVKESEGNDGKVENPNTKKIPNRRRKNQGPRQMIGSGASLLSRKARGAVGEETDKAALQEDFDFESKLKEFKIEESDSDDEEQDETVTTGNTIVYQKDDFFDSISCDVLDKQAGRDNRLRGADERNLNIDTFGATSLGHGRRGGRRGYKGRGRGRGRGGRGPTRPRENQRWNRDGGGESGRGRGDYGNGGRRHQGYGDGGLSANKSQTQTPAWA